MNLYLQLRENYIDKFGWKKISMLSLFLPAYDREITSAWQALLINKSWF